MTGTQVSLPCLSCEQTLIDYEFTADGKDDKNKSQIETSDDYGEKKRIPAGRPGAETDMAQTALYVACNQYLYGQVSFMTVKAAVID
jgi:hypothetical protein